MQALHQYRADDTDELSFDANELISVIAFDDPEEQVCCSDIFVNGNWNWNMNDLKTETETEKIFKTEIQ